MRKLVLPFLFVLLWAPTLTPLHRLYGFGARTTAVGVAEGLLLAAAAIAMGMACRRGWRIVAAAVAAGWIAMTLITAAAEPSRDRAAAARHLAERTAARQTDAAAPRRVLLLSIDGLDWNAIDRLVAVDALPFLKSVISSARLYEVDNHGRALSPGIWASAYTGADEPVQGFTKWRFPGTDRDIAVLPEWRHRPLFMLDRLLTAGARLQLWDSTAPTNLDFAHPPLWRVASAAGVRVGVFDPLPFDVAGERINGFFAWQTDDGFRVATAHDGKLAVVEHVRDDTSSASLDAIVDAERVRAAVAARAFAHERPDLGIYYTHVLDAAGHMVWEPGGPSDSDAADMRIERTRPLTSGRIADAYRAVDNAMRSVAESFGSPATLAIVSDHGWEFSVYAHRTAPLGVAIISGAASPGYGGTFAVERVAATVLALGGIPVPATIAAPLEDVVPHWTTCTTCAAAPIALVSPPGDGAERRDRLRSLGYVTK